MGILRGGVSSEKPLRRWPGMHRGFGRMHSAGAWPYSSRGAVPLSWLARILGLVCVVQLVAMGAGLVLIHWHAALLLVEDRLVLRPTPVPLPVPVNTSSSSEIPQFLAVYHVTKEHGRASMGGMGTMVTALAAEQVAQNQPAARVSVILPYYRFLRDPAHVHYTTLSLRIRADLLRRWWSSEWVAVQVSVFQELGTDGVWRKYIAPASTADYPFDHAFHALNPREIYSSASALPQEWQDLYFNKAVAALLQYECNNNQTSPSKMIAHIHGATNGMSIQFYWDQGRATLQLRQRIHFVYTMHDYGDEFLYTLQRQNIAGFLEYQQISAPIFSWQHYDRVSSHDARFTVPSAASTNATTALSVNHFCIGDRVFVSGLALWRSDVAVFVSETVATQWMYDDLDFHLRSLFLPLIQEKARRGSFFGISNGVSLYPWNPFTHPQLIEVGLHLQLDAQLSRILFPSPVESTSPLPPGRPSILEAKRDAKRLLSSKFGLFGGPRRQDLPLVLYVGRFQRQKGFEEILRALGHLDGNAVNLVLMGQLHNIPQSQITAQISCCRHFVTLLSTEQEQQSMGPLLRLASDIVLVPSWTESFGLVAAETLLFGSLVVSTGVGGLAEFLEPRPHSGFQEPDADWNAYLFPARNVDGMVMRLREAVEDCRWLREHGGELFLWQIVKKGLALGWKGPLPILATASGLVLGDQAEGTRRRAGPVEKYLEIYNMYA